MRLIIVILTLFTAISAYADVKAFVSIVPQKYFLEKIGGDKVDVSIMVQPGSSPATYEPKPKQMVQLSKTDIYFSIGVPFEKTWLKKFADLSSQMKIVKTDSGIKKRAMEAHTHHHDEHKHHGDYKHDKEHKHHDEHAHHHEHNHKSHEHSKGIKDPHIWLDPILVVKQSENIAKALCSADPENCSFYKSNQKSFAEELKALNKKITKMLQPYKGTHFMVFHPAWGYFADRYHLHQTAVEIEGKEPKPSELKEFVELAKDMKLKAIFVQPQFSQKSAKVIASEVGAEVIAMNPLAKDWENNLLKAAKTISGSL